MPSSKTHRLPSSGVNYFKFMPLFLLSFLVVLLLIAFSSLQYYLPFVSLYLNLKQDYNSSSIAQTILLPDGGVKHSFIVISDLDHNSKVSDQKNTWRSFLCKGTITVDVDKKSAHVQWEKEIQSLQSQISANGRAMELSDLVFYDGNVLSIDDRTGLIYKIVNLKNVVPWVFLNDGPGNTTKGFKGEWMTVKDQHLYVGSLGKEWTTSDGIFVNFNPMYVKVVNHVGEVNHVNWIDNYKKLRQAVDVEFPGYLIFESGQWSQVHKRWFFLPRRMSNKTYSETADEFQGTNLLFSANETFDNVIVKEIGSRGDGLRGFSAFQFLPDSNDSLIIALKSVERNGIAIATYVMIFNVETGHILLDETKIPEKTHKFEGILFI